MRTASFLIVTWFSFFFLLQSIPSPPSLFVFKLRKNSTTAQKAQCPILLLNYYNYSSHICLRSVKLYIAPVKLDENSLAQKPNMVADRLIAHASYNAIDAKFDIALVRIPKSQALKEPPDKKYDYNSICLPQNKQTISREVGVELELAGYGEISTSGHPTNELRKGHLWYSPDTCSVKDTCSGSLPNPTNLGLDAFCLKAEALESRPCVVCSYLSISSMNQILVVVYVHGVW